CHPTRPSRGLGVRERLKSPAGEGNDLAGAVDVSVVLVRRLARGRNLFLFQPTLSLDPPIGWATEVGFAESRR
ncbi:MAG TPA: hypothetical protein VN255_05575, partial [Mycobacterium sp.]|nr:hypothetical protein [Mycobacterium sp.]